MLPILLSSSQKDLLKAHLNSLDDDSKRMRFGYSISEKNISDYVEKSLDITKNFWYAYIDEGKCIGAVHIAIIGETAELGISIDQEHRGKKLSNNLFERALTHLKAFRISHITMQCLSENAVIQHLARKYGLKVRVLGPGEKEASGDIELPDSLTASIQDTTEDMFAVTDAIGRNLFWVQKSVAEILNNYLRKAIYDRPNKAYNWRRNRFRH